MTDRARNPPLVRGDDLGGPVREATVAGVVLAAGTSSRFEGRNKLLAEVDGDPLVVHAVRTLRAAEVNVSPLIAVVGYQSSRVREALTEHDPAGPDCIVENPHYREGQGTSVRAGIEAVGGVERGVGGTVGDDEDGDDGAVRVDAALFALGDMPAVRPGTVETLVAAYRAGAGAALAAAYEGRRGNPVLFGRTHFDALVNVDGDTGGREILLGSDDAALVETGDPGVLVDVDSPSDLESVR